MISWYILYMLDHVGSCWIILYTLAHMMSIWSILSYYIYPKTLTIVHMSYCVCIYLYITYINIYIYIYYMYVYIYILHICILYILHIQLFTYTIKKKVDWHDLTLWITVHSWPLGTATALSDPRPETSWCQPLKMAS